MQCTTDGSPVRDDIAPTAWARRIRHEQTVLSSLPRSDRPTDITAALAALTKAGPEPVI
ncbi:hypothetical protein GCM10017714_10750 [Curtobacterium pusillum]|nr:hypothetical protein GCM10017610_06200 [Curtobacterium pusillum]